MMFVTENSGDYVNDHSNINSSLQGDSGGPVLYKEDGQYTLIGVTHSSTNPKEDYDKIVSFV